MTSGVALSYRSGGHSYTCNGIKEDSIHLDMRSLDHVSYTDGLLTTPEEAAPPAVALAADALEEVYRADAGDDALATLCHDADLMAFHLAALGTTHGAARELTAAYALASLKIARSQDTSDLCRWLTKEERAAVLIDPELLTSLGHRMQARAA